MAQAASALRGAIDGWFCERRLDPRFARFAGHFAVLAPVLGRMLDRIDGALLSCREPGRAAFPSADTYRACREVEQAIVLARRFFDWYAGKYDQRLQEPAHVALAAADELVRSCWSQVCTAAAGSAPAGPLPYLDANFDALATPRVSVPPDLRAPADAPVAECVRELPIATIALPAHAADRGWWLVLAAHETGHHVCDELELEPAVRTAVKAAAGGAPHGTPEDARQWNRWSAETFADVFSALMVGGAAGWALAELQHAEPAQLVIRPADTARYPSPLVRLAVIGEAAAQAGLNGSQVTASAARAWVDSLADGSIPDASRAAAARHLEAVPTVAAALLDLRIDRGGAGGRTLAHLCDARAEWFAPGGTVAQWAGQLRRPVPSTPGAERRVAARQAIAAGVAAYDALARSSAAEPPRDEVRRLHGNLLGLLARCGERGVLAPAPPPPDLAALADRFADRLLGAAALAPRAVAEEAETTVRAGAAR